MTSTRRNLAATAAAALSSPAVAVAPEAPKERLLRIAHLTDLHVMPERAAALGMEKCLEACQAHGPDAIFMGGDLVMDSFGTGRQRALAQWEIYKRVLRANTTLPVEACLGNHDVFGWADAAKRKGQPGYGKRLALDTLGLERPYRSFGRAGWHFVVLDSTHEVDGNGYVAKLDEEQFEWLTEELERTPGDRPVLVMSHIPILGVSAYFDGDNETPGGWNVPGALMHIDARRIKDLFRKHPQVKACLSGHAHCVDRARYLGVDYFCNGAVSGGWWEGRYQEFGNGYAIVDLLDDGSVETRFHEFAWVPPT
jgi:3',5'-cyclic-AMP phosphodiesterase